MNISEKGVKFIKEVEGSSHIPYRDSANLLTIGVGHLLTKPEISSGKILIDGELVKFHNGLTEEQIEGILKQDLQYAQTAVNEAIIGAALINQNQFDALVSFTFNVGVKAFTNSTLLKRIKNGNYDLVPIELSRWNRAGGKVVEGLINRRNKEINLFEGLI